MRIFLALLILAPALAAGASTKQQPGNSGEQLAQRAATLLEQGDLPAIAKLLHYPAQYSAEERKRDVADTQKVLTFMVDRFGLPSQLKWHSTPLAFYEIGASGGTNEYWQSLSPFETNDFLYDAKFSKLGRGILKLRLFRPSDRGDLELQGVAFGLAATPSARATVIQATVDLARHMSAPVPPNFREILEQQLAPSSYRPPNQQ